MKSRYFCLDGNVIDSKIGKVVKTCHSNDQAEMYARRYNIEADAPKREESADDRGYTEDSFGYNYDDWN